MLISKDAEGCPGGDAMKLFGGRNRGMGAAPAPPARQAGAEFRRTRPIRSYVFCLVISTRGDVRGFRDFSAEAIQCR